jgi:hypothetical protein
MGLRDLVVRQPKQPAVRESSIVQPVAGEARIVGPRPSYFAATWLEPQHPMPEREMWGYVFWGLLGAFILVTETLAAFWSGFPIPTISWTTGQLELHNHWFKLVVVGSLVLIATRIVFYPWPYRRLDD